MRQYEAAMPSNAQPHLVQNPHPGEILREEFRKPMGLSRSARSGQGRRNRGQTLRV